MSENRRVLSVYVDLSPTRQVAHQYLGEFRTHAADTRKALPEGEAERFDAAVGLAAEVITGAKPGSPGLAVFVSDPPGYNLSIPLGEPAPDGVYWGEHPHVSPWLAVIDRRPPFILAIVDKSSAEVGIVRASHLEDPVAFETEVPGRQKTGDWFGLAESRFRRHQAEHVRQHIDEVVEAIGVIAAENPPARIVLAGPPEATQLLRERLPHELEEKVAGHVPAELFGPVRGVVERAATVVADAEARSDAAAVEALVTRAAKGDRAVTGEGLVFEALEAGRVHRLLVADDFALREPAMALAFATSAEVEFIRGEAKATLAQHGGVGALLRY